MGGKPSHPKREEEKKRDEDSDDEAKKKKEEIARVASVPVRGGSVSSMRWSPTHHVLAFAGEGGDRGNAGSVALWAAPSSARR